MHLLIVRHCAEAKKVNKRDMFSACLKFIIDEEEAGAHVTHNYAILVMNAMKHKYGGEL